MSDIHLDINIARKDPKFLTKLVEYLQNLSADVLIFTGDIAGKTSLVIEFFEETNDLPIENKLFVPGNHDIWVNQEAKDLSMAKYYDILPEIASRSSWNYLPNNPLILDQFGFVGTMGWYDYSSRNKIWDNQISMADYSAKIHPDKKVELMDRHFVKFGMSDDEMAQALVKDLEQDIGSLREKAPLDELDSLFVLTHMVPFSQFINYRGILRYDFFTAYFGNFNLGETIRITSEEINTYSIFGQTHLPKQLSLSSQLHGYCVPLGYPREYGRDIELSKLFAQRIVELEIK